MPNGVGCDIAGRLLGASVFSQFLRNADLDVADTASIEKLVGKIKREAKKALNHKDVPRNKNLKEARVKAQGSHDPQGQGVSCRDDGADRKGEEGRLQNHPPDRGMAQQQRLSVPARLQMDLRLVHRQITGDDPVQGR
jgi:hypothetical protein